MPIDLEPNCVLCLSTGLRSLVIQLTLAGTVIGAAPPDPSPAIVQPAIPDTTPPEVLSVGSVDGQTIGICFNELLDGGPPGMNTATDIANYTVNGGAVAVSNIHLRPDGQSVSLELLGVLRGEFMVSVDGVADRQGNAIIGPITRAGRVLGFTGQRLGPPLEPGSNFACDSAVVELRAGGAQIGGTGDEGYWVYHVVEGDFDAKVQLLSLSRPEPDAQAGLMARESTNSGGRTIHLLANPPPPGANQITPGLRSVETGPTTTWGTAFAGANLPDAWLRLVRVSDAFTGYRSSNGLDWVLMGQITQSYSASIFLGLAASAHTTNAGLQATGRFSNFVLVREDLGDAPATYPTLRLNDGARHTLVPGIRLGADIDSEADGQPGPGAGGDDSAALDDEDGVEFPAPLIPGGTFVPIEVTVSVDGFIDGWLDFNADGDWNDSGERLFQGQPVTAGNNTLNLNVPNEAVPTNRTFARFRFSTTGGLEQGGPAADGEVEDYRVAIVVPVDLALAQMDAPDPVAVGRNLTYTITVRNNGPSVATGVTLSDLLPAPTVFVSASPGCAHVGQTVTCDLGTLPFNASTSVVIVVRPTSTGTLTNFAMAGSDDTDPAPANNVETTLTKVSVPPQLAGVTFSGGVFSFSFATEIGCTYVVEFKNSLTESAWSTLATVPGNGMIRVVTDPSPASPTRFYRVRLEAGP